MTTLAWLGALVGSAAFTAAALLIVGWLARTWIKARLDASIQLSTGKKLAEFTRRLDAAEAQITAVRHAGIDANLQLNAAVVTERVAAIKAVWKATMDWRAANAVSGMVSVFDLDYVRQHAGSQPLIDSMQGLMRSVGNLELLTKLNSVLEWRPFVNERAWALFGAYHGFFVGRMSRAAALTMRNPDLAIRFWEADSESQIVRATAPANISEVYAASSFHGTAPFLAYVEQQLLEELQRSLAGEHTGPEAQRQAAAIVAATETALATAQQPPVPPG